jgi:hypothetical protein
MGSEHVRKAGQELAAGIDQFSDIDQMRLLALMAAIVLERQPRPFRVARAHSLAEGIVLAYGDGSFTWPAVRA